MSSPQAAEETVFWASISMNFHKSFYPRIIIVIELDRWKYHLFRKYPELLTLIIKYRYNIQFKAFSIEAKIARKLHLSLYPCLLDKEKSICC